MIVAGVAYAAGGGLKGDDSEKSATAAVTNSEEDSAPQAWYTQILSSAGNLFSSSEKAPTNLMTKAVTKGRFRIIVNERGFLDSQNNETLTCEVPGSTTIIKIVPEGIYVHKGDVICELDSSQFEEKSRQQEIDVTQAKAALLNAEENLAIQLTQNDSDMSIANLNLQFSKLDEEKYKLGELPQDKDKILGQIRLKEEELIRKGESYEFTKRMTKKGYRSQSDLEVERLSVTQAEINLKVEKDNLRVLNDYTSIRKIAELEADVLEYGRDLERIERKGKATVAKLSADLESRTLTLKVEEEKYAEWLTRIENCIMIAPQDGEIVYAKSSSSRRSSSEPEISEGATVRERQPIINIPDVTLMKIDAKIHESMISQVKEGQPVTVTADAQPGKFFNGIVYEISSVPLSGSWPNYDIKEYQVVINLTDAPDHVSLLRPGLSADFEIVVQDRMEVVQVPMQSVVQIGKDYYCWVLSGTKLERRKLKLGDSNDTSIEIFDGVEVNELAVMNPRSRFSDEISLLEESFASSEELSPIKKPIDPSLMNKQRGAEQPGKPRGGAQAGQSGGKGPGGKAGGKGRPGGAGKGKPSTKGSTRG